MIGIVAVGTALDENSKKSAIATTPKSAENNGGIDEDALKETLKEMSSWKSVSLVDTFGIDCDVSSNSDSGVSSGLVFPIKRMEFPHQDVKAEIAYKCDPEIILIRFTDVPNLVGGEILEGIKSISLDVDVNDKQQSYRWEANQTRGDKRLFFLSNRNDYSVLREHLSGDTFSISIPWYNQGDVTFRWDTENAIETIDETCKS